MRGHENSQEKATAANDGLDLLLTLSLRWGRWQRLIGKRRSTSRHAEALALACALPALSPAHLARTLGLTTRGASLICQELADLGCLVEVTGRRNYRLFVAVDQDGVAAVVAPRRPSLDQVVPVADPSARKPLSEFRFEPLPPLEIDFGPLFADVDIAMKAAQGAAKRGLDFLQEFHERRLREALAETDLPSEWDDPEEAA